MELFIVFNSSILPIFIIITAAYIYNRLAHPDISRIVHLVTMIFVPVFVFDSLMDKKLTLGMLINPFIFMILLTTALILISHFTAKITGSDEDDRITLILAGSMINIGNFGIPLIHFSYGEMADVYSVLNFIAFNIPLSTVAIYLTSKEKHVKKILMDIAKIPIFYSIILALLVSYFSIPIPKSINNCIELSGPAAVPLLIFILGLQLSNIRMKQGFIALLIPGIIIRLIISPFVALGILALLGVSGLEMRVAMVQTSAPAALLPLLYAIRFKRSPDFLATMIMITTILSGVTLTLLIRILG